MKTSLYTGNLEIIQNNDFSSSEAVNWCVMFLTFPNPDLSSLTEPLKCSPTVNKKGDAGQNPKSGALSEQTVLHSLNQLSGPGKTLAL